MALARKGDFRCAGKEEGSTRTSVRRDHRQQTRAGFRDAGFRLEGGAIGPASPEAASDPTSPEELASGPPNLHWHSRADRQNDYREVLAKEEHGWWSRKGKYCGSVRRGRPAPPT